MVARGGIEASGEGCTPPGDFSGATGASSPVRSTSSAPRRRERPGVAVRAVDLSALPLLKRLGTTTAARASCYLYTRTQDIDPLVSALREIAEV
jgi:selenocysteine lyase/cysteine desulfurase